MAFYAHKDSLARPQRLPKSWRNVSGLNLLSDAELLELGWYPWEGADQPEHDTIHEYLESTTELQDGKAVQVWAVKRREIIPSVERVAEDTVRALKAAAGETILARLPYHRQLNYQQRAIELLDIRRQRELTEQEMADYDHIMAERDWLDAVRAESNRLEAEIASIAASELSDDEKRVAIAALSFNPDV